MVFGVLLVFTFISKLIALFQKRIINKREDTELPPTTLHHSLYMFGKGQDDVLNPISVTALS